MMSRVQCLDQVYILNDLNVDKITVSGQALFELERLEEISFNRNLTTWYRNDGIHVASMNCAGLRPHIADIRRDHKLLLADLIQLQEISLDPNHENECQLLSHNASFISCGLGKGIASFHKSEAVSSSIKENYFQISRLEIHGIQCINVYRSQEGSIRMLMDKLDGEIDTG